MELVDLKSKFASYRGQAADTYHSSETSGNVISDDEFYINSAYQFIADYAMWPWLETVDETLDSVASQQEYSLPSTIRHPILVKVDNYVCAPSSKREILIANDTRSTPMTGTPRHYYLFGDGSSTKIGFHPTPASAGTNNIYFYGIKPITLLTNDSDYPLFQTQNGYEYLSVIMAGAMYYFIQKETDNIDLHERKWRVFMRELKNMKKALLRKNYDYQTISMQKAHRGYWPPEGHIPRTEYP